MFGSTHLVLNEDSEIIINRKHIGVIRKWKEKERVIIEDSQQNPIVQLDGDLARSFWEEEVRRTSATFNGQPEYWEADITQLNRNQLFFLIEAITLLEYWGDDHTFSERISNAIPIEFLNHITSIDSPGRCKFLSSIAESLYYSSLIQSQLALVDPTPTQIIEANS